MGKTTRKGSANDYRTIKFLASFGFHSSMKSAASKGVFDTVSWGPNAIIFVQNKTNAMPPKDEMLRLIRSESPPCCSYRFLFIWYDYQRKPEAWLLDKEKETASLLSYEELSEILLKGGCQRE